MITTREAKRIALKNIIDTVRSDIADDSAHWTLHPEKGHELVGEDKVTIQLAAEEILAVMERRAGRLRSFGV